MFRTATNIVMTCLLLISTTGFAVSKHYCGNELVSIELKSGAEPCCDDGMCCSTETRFLQLENEYLPVTPRTNPGNIFVSDLIITSSEVALPLPETSFITALHYSASPPRCMTTRLALKQSYLL